MTDAEINYRKLYAKYGETMSAREVMKELDIGSTRRLNAIPADELPRSGGGRQGTRIVYLTSCVANYMANFPPRKARGYHVEMDARELSRFFAKHQLNQLEKAALLDVWGTALVYGDEAANLELDAVISLSGIDALTVKSLTQRGVQLNPLRTGVFEARP